MKSKLVAVIAAFGIALPMAVSTSAVSLAAKAPLSTVGGTIGLSCPDGATSLDDCDALGDRGEYLPSGLIGFRREGFGDVYVEWDDSRLIMPKRDSCSRYYFAYANYTGIRLLALDLDILDPFGTYIDGDWKVGVDSGSTGEFDLQICSWEFVNGSGPYTLRFSIEDYSSNTRQTSTQINFMPRGGHFRDDDGNTHEGNIEAIRRAGLTYGCNPPKQDLYCPKDSVTRGQMAAFLRRALDLPVPSRDYFKDDNASTFQKDINAIRAAGITFGCNPPKNDRFCPNDVVTREQMAAFLVRAFGYPDAKVDYFKDDNRSTLQSSINALAQAGVTYGCNPPSNTNFCPKDAVKRDQMASFFARALGLEKLSVPPRS